MIPIKVDPNNQIVMKLLNKFSILNEDSNIKKDAKYECE